MIEQAPPICFYVPSSDLVSDVPDTVESYWHWVDSAIRRSPAEMPDKAGLCTWLGPYNWTIQTFIYLRASGLPCIMTSSLTNEGIIISHSDFLPRYFRPSSKQYLVELKPDRALKCCFSNFVVVQNRLDPITRHMGRLLVNSEVLHLWPGPGLICRDPARGDTFENICYMGNLEQFITGADNLEKEILKRGLRWKMVRRDRWHDYSTVDAIVAVRNPDETASQASQSSRRKPASKLINAWSAGVPAILSPIFAFMDLRKSEFDFLVASTPDQIIHRIEQLMIDPELRRLMTKNGLRRANEFPIEKRIDAWITVLERQIVPKFVTWTKSRFQRQLYFATRKIARTCGLL